MSPSKEPMRSEKKVSRQKQKRDPGLWIQEYLGRSRSAEEMLFKINELLYAGQFESTRKYVRVPISFPVIFRVGMATVAGSSYTLSEKGMFIRCADPPAVGSVIQVGLALPDGGSAIQAEAEVIHSTPLQQAAKNSNLSGMAVVFTKLSAEDRKRIDRLVRAEARRMKKRGK